MLYIGRTPDNHLCLNYEKVSKRHCSIEKTPDGHFLIKDLNSANGTFVNGVRVQQTTLKSSDQLQLGDKVVELPLILNLLSKNPIPKLAYEKLIEDRQGIDEEITKLKQYQTKFQKLEQVYNKFKEDKHKLQHGTQQKALVTRGIIMGTGVLISGSIYLTALLTHYDMKEDPYILKILMTIITALAGVIVTFASPNMMKMNEKIEAMTEQYMDDFVCPRCKKFLGYMPYKQVARNKSCPSCRVQLVD